MMFLDCFLEHHLGAPNARWYSGKVGKQLVSNERLSEAITRALNSITRVNARSRWEFYRFSQQNPDLSLAELALHWERQKAAIGSISLQHLRPTLGFPVGRLAWNHVKDSFRVSIEGKASTKRKKTARSAMSDSRAHQTKKPRQTGKAFPPHSLGREERRVFQLLSKLGGWRNTRDLEQHSGMAKKTIHQAVRTLLNQGRIQGYGRSQGRRYTVV